MKGLKAVLCATTAVAALGGLAQTGPAQAQDEASTPVRTTQLAQNDRSDTIVVFGRAIDLTGEAESASEGVVGYADFSTRPLLRVGELVEVIPGAIATQHSGAGKANQYFLRGFNLDHGTDLAGSIDGTPLNLNSHPHMSGYLDLNFVIPELIETVRFTKGPQHAEQGDHSLAGSASFRTYDRLDQGFVQLDADDDGLVRLLFADSYEVAEDGSFLIAASTQTNEGPFDLSEDLEYFSGMAKLVLPTDFGPDFRAQLIGYDSEWRATDQIPLRAVESGLIGRFGYLDPGLGGATHRYIGSAGLEWDRASLLAYAQNYALDLYGNPTFFIDQVNGDQFVQVDRRWSYGAAGRLSRDVALAGRSIELNFGADVDLQDIDRSGLFLTTDRVVREPVRDDAVELFTADVFAEAVVPLTEHLRAVLGVRADHYDYDVSAIQAENSGEGSDEIVSPKLSLAYAATDALELYANYGYGFHSNDARGAATTVDPVTGDPVDPVDLLVEGKGGEVGFRYHPSTALNFSLAVFQLELDSESIFVGDAGTSEPSGGTERSGAEVAGFWQPLDWLAVDATAAWSHARFKDAAAGEDRIPNSVDFVAAAGVTALWDNGMTGSFRVRHLGESALIEDNSVRSKPTTIANVGLAKDFGRFEIGVDVLNVLDSDENDITYFYESQLLGEAAPVEDIHFHPVHPRAFKVVLRADF